MQSSPRTGSSWAGLLTLAILGCTAPGPADGADRRDLASTWGIEIASVRLSAAGSVVDFRYRVLDAEKSLPIVDGTHEPYLVDRASGKVLGVPRSAKVGALRQSTRGAPPHVGRVYFILFGNPGRLLHPGSRVDVVIGSFRARDLVVE